MKGISIFAISKGGKARIKKVELTNQATLRGISGSSCVSEQIRRAWCGNTVHSGLGGGGRITRPPISIHFIKSNFERRYDKMRNAKKNQMDCFRCKTKECVSGMVNHTADRPIVPKYCPTKKHTDLVEEANRLLYQPENHKLAIVSRSHFKT